MAAGEPEAMELPSYEDLGEATDLSAVEVAWHLGSWLKWPYEWMYVMKDIGNSFQGEEYVEHSTWFLGNNKICEILLGLELHP